VRRILLPFTGTAISRRAVDAAIRLAIAEQATLVPAYLAAVPLTRSLEAPLPLECEGALPLLEAIEQLAIRRDVEVDSRIERGRSARDALQRLLDVEGFDRVVVPASNRSETGFSPDDVAWILDRVPGEVVVFRSASEDERVLDTASA
jgi:nucleotide-binding universal stress UspA family protein